MLTLIGPIVGLGTAARAQENDQNVPKSRAEASTESPAQSEATRCADLIDKNAKYLSSLKGFCEQTDSKVKIENTTASFPNLDEIGSGTSATIQRLDNNAITQ